VFIPAFVDLRVRLDVPKGIAASAAGGKRQAVIDKALEEWKRDSADPAIERTCKSVDASIPPAAKADVQRLASACLAEAACESFVKCIMPLMEKQLQQRAPK
jgi:hypothetical protein